MKDQKVLTLKIDESTLKLMEVGHVTEGGHIKIKK
jgi:hypothetical protein